MGSYLELGSQNRPMVLIAYEFPQRQPWPLPLSVRRGHYRRHRFPIGYEQFSVGERDLRQSEVLLLVRHGGFTIENALLPLGLLVDALRSAGAGSITLLFDYLPYGRCMDCHRPGQSLGMAVFGHFLDALPVDRYLFFDLHDESALAFLRKPVAIFSTLPLWERHIRTLGKIDLLVSPDLGRQKSLERLGQNLALPVIVLDKHRPGGFLSSHDRHQISGRHIFLWDDELVSGATLNRAIGHLEGASSIDIGILYNFSHAHIASSLGKRNNVKSFVVSDLIPALKSDGVTILPLLSEMLANILLSSTSSHFTEWPAIDGEIPSHFS